ncbi:MAG: hypothetical protein M3276_09075, partial [Actinomycetota bacterium]|nr:hypothetical protein [Actinomycetota bacterium]
MVVRAGGSRRWLAAATVAAAAALTAALWALSGRLPESGWTTHAVSHLAVGIPAALLAAAGMWW